jgi:hypothetical protein
LAFRPQFLSGSAVYCGIHCKANMCRRRGSLRDTDHIGMCERLENRNGSRKRPMGISRSNAECIRAYANPRKGSRVDPTRTLALNDVRIRLPDCVDPEAAVLRNRTIARLVPGPANGGRAGAASRNANVSWGGDTADRRRTVVQALMTTSSRCANGDSGGAYENKCCNHRTYKFHQEALRFNGSSMPAVVRRPKWGSTR